LQPVFIPPLTGRFPHKALEDLGKIELILVSHHQTYLADGIIGYSHQLAGFVYPVVDKKFLRTGIKYAPEDLVQIAAIRVAICGYILDAYIVLIMLINKT
jgi:hypothetical protein